jgi:hypothetical protein
VARAEAKARRADQGAGREAKEELMGLQTGWSPELVMRRVLVQGRQVEVAYGDGAVMVTAAGRLIVGYALEVAEDGQHQVIEARPSAVQLQGPALPLTKRLPIAEALAAMRASVLEVGGEGLPIGAVLEWAWHGHVARALTARLGAKGVPS